MSYITSELTEGYFQQDNTTAHSARQTIAYLKKFFNARVVEFPARSPDLTVMDYFIYPHLKNTVFRSTRHTIEELCEATSIRDNILNICSKNKYFVLNFAFPLYIFKSRSE
jgi:hypothetical protein